MAKFRFRLTADFILYAVALANAVRIGWAYAYVDAGGNIFSAPGVAGAILGMVLSVGTAFVAGKIPSLKARIRIRLSWASLALILALEPVILAPITVTDMPAPLKATLGVFGSWLWGIVAALLPSLVIAAVSFANGSMVESAAPSDEKPATSEIKPNGLSRKAKPSGLICATCGFEAKSKQALAGHQLKHKAKKPDESEPKPATSETKAP